VDIVAIGILATLAGADNMVAVATYGQEEYEWLSTFLELPNGIPSHDTFSRVFGLIDPDQFNRFFLRWIEHVSQQLDIKLIHLDGKTLRGSYDRESQLKALHSVSAWSSEHHLVLAQQRVDEKSNEITAIPELLKLMNIKHTIITIDAMGTQREIAKQIIKEGGDYILALKANQGNLYKDVKKFFKHAHQMDWEGIEYSYDDGTSAGHHRIEYRQVWVVPIAQIPKLANAKKWAGFKSIVMVRRKRTLWNGETDNPSYYISSLEPDAALIAHSIRSHWSIENSLHWVLDVTFNEDHSRIRMGYGPENVALLRRLCINLIKQHPSKDSIKTKRFRAALSREFLVELLTTNRLETSD
jgi:predicted transposase YbfD/YdcC